MATITFHGESMMRTSQQVRNRLLRDMGIKPRANYHYRLRLGDRVKARIVEDEPPVDLTVSGVVREIEEHGWYSHIRLWLPEQRTSLWVTIYRDGPSAWGVVAINVVERVAFEPEGMAGRI